MTTSNLVTSSGSKDWACMVQKDMLIDWLAARDFSVIPRMTAWHNFVIRDKNCE